MLYMLWKRILKQLKGFIRLGSPVMSIKPRNTYLEGTVGMGTIPMTRFNRHGINGFIIVPSQPFGYNYLGGKLLKVFVVPKVKEQIDKEYDMDLCLFETTSFYGSSKEKLSQYDSMKPFIRYKGLTTSSFTPNMHDKAFGDFRKWFMEKNGDHIVDPTVSGEKMKTQMRMAMRIKDSLKQYDVKEYEKVCQFHKDTTKLNEQKRFFYFYGYENVPQIIRGEKKPY